MIYLLLWENYFRNELINNWKEAFKNKYNELNIFHLRNAFDYDLNFYNQNLFSSWFFSEKNLVIVDDFPFAWLKSDQEKYLDYFLNNLAKVDADKIFIFNNKEVDKRSKLYKEILKIWEIKDFSIWDIEELKLKLYSLYKDRVSSEAIDYIVNLKWNNFWNIYNELNKYLLSKDYIQKSDLAYVSKDLNESIFDFINDILNLNFNNIPKTFDLLLDESETEYAFFNLFCSNLRIYYHIFNLKNNWYSQDTIKNILNLWNRSFLIQKNFRISFSNFSKFYNSIIQLDSKMKTWKMIWNSPNDFYYHLSKSFIYLK